MSNELPDNAKQTDPAVDGRNMFNQVTGAFHLPYPRKTIPAPKGSKAPSKGRPARPQRSGRPARPERPSSRKPFGGSWE